MLSAMAHLRRDSSRTCQGYTFIPTFSKKMLCEKSRLKFMYKLFPSQCPKHLSIFKTKRRSRRKKALEREYALFAQKVKKSKSNFSRKKSKSNFSKKNSKSQKVTFRAKSQKVTFRKTTQKLKKSLFAQKVKK